MILHMIHWRHSSEHSMVVMMILAGRHQPKKGLTSIRRGESGGEWKGGPLGSPAYLFIWLESCGNTTTSPPLSPTHFAAAHSA